MPNPGCCWVTIIWGHNRSARTSLSPKNADDSKLLGKGSFGSVYLISKDGQTLAVKKFNSDNDEGKTCLDREKLKLAIDAINKQFTLREFHEHSLHVVQVLSEFSTKGISQYTMSYHNAVTLKEAIKNRGQNLLNMTEATLFSTQIVSVLQWMGVRGLMHSDLKPGNILVEGNDRAFNITVCDVDSMLLKDSVAKKQVRWGNVTMTPLYQHPNLPYQKHSCRNAVVQLADLEKHVYFTVLMLSMEFFSRKFYQSRRDHRAQMLHPTHQFKSEKKSFYLYMSNPLGTNKEVEPAGQLIMNFCNLLKGRAFDNTNKPGLLSPQSIMFNLNEAAKKMGDESLYQPLTPKASPPIPNC